MKRKLIAKIQAAINKLEVPKTLQGKQKGDYYILGMRATIRAIASALE